MGYWSRIRKIASFLGIFLLVGGLAAGIFLVQRSQELRKKAFTGYEFGGQVKKDVLHLASPQEMVVNDSLADTNSIVGLFYTYSRALKDFQPEIQYINEPDLQLAGKMFLKYDDILNKSFVFGRIENLPLSGGKFIHLWRKAQDGSFQSLGLGEVKYENNIPVTYLAYLSENDIRVGGKSLVVAYDSRLDITQPEGSIIEINF